MAEAIEELHLLLAVAAHRVLGRQLFDELAHAGSQLVGEVRRRRSDELVDVVRGRLRHRREAYRGQTRALPVAGRPCSVDPELVGDEAPVGVRLVVANPRRDEVDRVRVDHGRPQRTVDQLAIELGPHVGSSSGG